MADSLGDPGSVHGSAGALAALPDLQAVLGEAEIDKVVVSLSDPAVVAAGREEEARHSHLLGRNFQARLALRTTAGDL